MIDGATAIPDSPRLTWQRVTASALLLGVALVVWGHSSSALQDIILWSCVLYVLIRKARAVPTSWQRPPGLLFVVLAVYTLIGLPLSVRPATSTRELVKIADLVAFAAVLPALLITPRHVERGLVYSATAVSLILGADLVRLVRELGPTLFAAAHEHEPFVLGHSPNVAACAAGLAAIVLVAASLHPGRRPVPRACAAVGALVNIAYLLIIASRGAQLAMVGTACAAAFLLPRKHWVRAILLALLVVLGTVAVARPGLINKRFEDPISMKGFADRDKVWAHTWALSKERPVLGYGYGHRVFREVYRASNPPRARFDFQHPHSYWMNALFAQGALGVLLYAAAWAGLAIALLRRLYARDCTAETRSLVGTVILLLIFLHAFGIGDFPGSVARMAMIWLIPCALVLTRGVTAPHRRQRLCVPASPTAGS